MSRDFYLGLIDERAPGRETTVGKKKFKTKISVSHAKKCNGESLEVTNKKEDDDDDD